MQNLTANERELLTMLETVLRALRAGEDVPTDDVAAVVIKYRGY